MTISLSNASEGSYTISVPEGLFRRLTAGASSPNWWMSVKGQKRKTPYRWDGGSKAQSRLNVRQAAEYRLQALAGLHAPAPKVDPASRIATVKQMVEMWLLGFPKESRRRQDETDNMAGWIKELGALPYNEVLPSTIKAAAARLVESGLAESTVNRRLTSLQACFRDHITEAEPNPVERVKRFRVDKRVPGGRAVSYELISKILEQMPDMGQSANGHGKRARKDAIKRSTVSRTKLRLTLMAYTGLPPQLISEIQPKVDVRFDKTPPQLRVRPRKKGGGTNERWIELNPQGADALRACIDHGAIGPFSRHSAYKSWQRACEKVRAAQIEAGEEPMGHMRPYDLRHSFITKSAQDSDGNLMGVQHNAIHSTPQQTMMYAEGAMTSEAKKVTAAWTMPKVKKPARVLKMGKKR